MERQQDPRTSALWESAIQRMESSMTNLQAALDQPALLPKALQEEQAAYRALLQVQQREFEVTRRNRQRGQQGGAQGSREQEMQLELDQMELTQSQNRYETQRQAQAPQMNAAARACRASRGDAEATGACTNVRGDDERKGTSPGAAPMRQ